MKKVWNFFKRLKKGGPPVSRNIFGQTRSGIDLEVWCRSALGRFLSWLSRKMRQYTRFGCRKICVHSIGIKIMFQQLRFRLRCLDHPAFKISYRFFIFIRSKRCYLKNALPPQPAHERSFDNDPHFFVAATVPVISRVDWCGLREWGRMESH